MRNDDQASISGGQRLTRNPARRFCWKCGLAEGDSDLAGCTMDILSAHEYVRPGARPFRDFTYEELTARHARAVRKAQGAYALYTHLLACPASSAESFEARLYQQKAIKRYRLALALMDEIGRRISDATTGLS